MSKRAAILQPDLDRVFRAVARHVPGARVVVDLDAKRVEITTGPAAADDGDSAGENPLDWLLNETTPQAR